MAVEDYTTYTETTDNNSRISLVGTNHIDFDTRRSTDSDDEVWLYNDRGVDHFGDFEHKVDCKYNNFAWAGIVWGLSNAEDQLLDADPHIGVMMYDDIYLRELYSTTQYLDSWTGVVGTWYYLTIKKVGTALTCKIYDNANREAGDLLATLSLTLHADHKFRYIYGCSTWWYSSTLRSSNLDIENLDLQEGWRGKFCGVTNPGKINGVSVANIAKVNGVASS